MIRWLILGLLTLALIGCSQPTATPTPFAVPTSPIVVVTATGEPNATSLPTEVNQSPTEALEPTITPLATITLLPTVTPAVNPSATSRGTGGAGTTPVAVRYKYPAPVLLGPSRPTMYKNNNDITFTYGSVGKILPSECYLLHVELINPNVATANNRGDDYLDPHTSHCGDQSVSGKPLSFVLYRGRFRNLPNYGTILAETLALAPLGPTQVLKLTWYVQVVQNNGLMADGVHYQTKPSRPPIALLDLDFDP